MFFSSVERIGILLSSILFLLMVCHWQRQKQAPPRFVSKPLRNLPMTLLRCCMRYWWHNTSPPVLYPAAQLSMIPAAPLTCLLSKLYESLPFFCPTSLGILAPGLDPEYYSMCRVLHVLPMYTGFLVFSQESIQGSLHLLNSCPFFFVLLWAVLLTHHKLIRYFRLHLMKCFNAMFHTLL